MIYFDTDYMAGAHPKVMERLVQTNAEQTVGYGSDDYTARAKELVKNGVEVLAVDMDEELVNSAVVVMFASLIIAIVVFAMDFSIEAVMKSIYKFFAI